jgi:hypothetical protein
VGSPPLADGLAKDPDGASAVCAQHLGPKVEVGVHHKVWLLPGACQADGGLGWVRRVGRSNLQDAVAATDDDVGRREGDVRGVVKAQPALYDQLGQRRRALVQDDAPVRGYAHVLACDDKSIVGWRWRRLVNSSVWHLEGLRANAEQWGTVHHLDQATQCLVPPAVGLSPPGQVASSDQSTQLPLPPVAGGTPVQSSDAQAMACRLSALFVVPAPAHVLLCQQGCEPAMLSSAAGAFEAGPKDVCSLHGSKPGAIANCQSHR